MNNIPDDFDKDGNFILHIIKQTWHIVKLTSKTINDILKDLISQDLFNDKDKDKFRDDMME